MEVDMEIDDMEGEPETILKRIPPNSMPPEPRVQVISALYLDCMMGKSHNHFRIKPTAPYLALLGNIGAARESRLFSLLRRLLRQYKVIFFVAGNYEPYRNDWYLTTDELTTFAMTVNEQAAVDENCGYLCIMDQTRYDLDHRTTILGCTLFSALRLQRMYDVTDDLGDFSYIKRWSVEKHRLCHESDLAWLNSEVEKLAKQEPYRRVVIFTHYCPTNMAARPKNQNRKKALGFTTNLTDSLCWTSPNVTTWAVGHTHRHYNCDFIDEATGKRVLTNQYGDFNERVLGFDMEKTLDFT